MVRTKPGIIANKEERDCQGLGIKVCITVRTAVIISSVLTESCVRKKKEKIGGC